jgi:hypothetical protein
MTAPDGKAGTKGPCPRCGQRLQVPNPVRRTIVGKLVSAATRRRPAPVVAPVAERVPVVSCPHCQGKLAVRPEHVGQVLQCVHCKGKAQLASTPSGLALRPVSPFADLPVTALPEVRESDWGVDLEDDYRERARAVRRQGGNGAGIAGLTLGCVAASIVFTGYFIFCGIGNYLAIPLSVAGFVCSCFGRGGTRVAGIIVSLLSLALAVLAVVYIAEQWKELFSR